jgi:RNA-directed DNA polymerase
LANIALHGMEEQVKQYVETLKLRYPGGTVLSKRDRRNSVSLIRYADDFVILHEDLTVVQRCQEIIKEWLSDMGLELKPSKTRLCHTLRQVGGESPGFDFLGFNVRQYPVGKHQSGKNTKKELLGFKTLIKPSKEAIKAHYDKIASIIEAHKAAPQGALIKSLNPVIRGWANYHRTSCCKQVFSQLDSLIYNKLRRWAFRRHPNKSRRWVSNKYWHTHGGRNWVFSTPSNSKITGFLLNHDSISKLDYVNVRGEASPYNGEAVYWSKRMGKHPTMPKQKAKLLQQQEGKCAWCKTYFKEGDLLEVDHKQPISAGGSWKRENLQLLHRHCHDDKSQTDQQWREHKKLGEWLDANPW